MVNLPENHPNPAEAPHILTANFLQLLTAEKADELLGDEGDENPVTGKRRVLYDAEEGRLAVAVYKEEDRESMQELIEAELGAAFSKPKGHIEFVTDKYNTGPKATATIYVGEEGITAKASVWHVLTDVAIDQEESCFNMLRWIGLGDTWGLSLLQHLKNPNVTHQTNYPMDEPEIIRLNMTLEDFAEI